MAMELYLGARRSLESSSVYQSCHHHVSIHVHYKSRYNQVLAPFDCVQNYETIVLKLGNVS